MYLIRHLKLNKPPRDNRPTHSYLSPAYIHTMSGTAGRVASKIGQAATQAAGKAAESGSNKKTGVLSKGAKKDPELYVRRFEATLYLSRK